MGEARTVEAEVVASYKLEPSCLPTSIWPMLTPAFLRQQEQYQSMVGSINWLSTNTRPDLTPITSFLAAYNHNPSTAHVDSAV